MLEEESDKINYDLGGRGIPKTSKPSPTNIYWLKNWLYLKW